MRKQFQKLIAAALWVAGLSMASVLSGCVTPSPWPAPSTTPVTIHWFVPSYSMKPEAAIGALKNLQGQTFTLDYLRPITQLDVDAYGYRASAAYTTTTSGKTYVPNNGGIFVGNKYVPTYSGSYQPWERQQNHEELLVIPFNRVKEIHLLSFPTLTIGAWGVVVDLQGGTRMGGSGALFNDEASAREFAEAVASLAKAQGWDGGPPSQGRIGLMPKDLTPDQIKDIARPDVLCGVLVIGVEASGPADKANIKEGDVLLTIDGEVASSDQFSSLMKQPTAVIRGLRRGMVTNEKGRLVPGWSDLTFNVSRWGM